MILNNKLFLFIYYLKDTIIHNFFINNYFYIILYKKVLFRNRTLIKNFNSFFVLIFYLVVLKFYLLLYVQFNILKLFEYNKI